MYPAWILWRFPNLFIGDLKCPKNTDLTLDGEVIKVVKRTLQCVAEWSWKKLIMRQKGESNFFFKTSSNIRWN